MNEVLKIVLMSSGGIIYLLFISKVLGKKQIAQMDFIDYVIGISIGSIIAEMATDVSEKPWYYYAVAMTVFLVFNLIIMFVERKGPALKHFFKGRPLMIVYEGKIDYKALKKSKLDTNDLIALARDKGYFDINQIAYAIFENNGILSILPKSNFKPATLADLQIDTQPASLANHLVVDGHISLSTLAQLEKDTAWLFKQLDITNKKQLKQIILATYDNQTDKVTVHKKQASN